MTKRELRSQREVRETGIVDPLGVSDFIVTPMSAAIDGDSRPTIEVKREAGTDAPRIYLDATTYGEYSSGKYTVDIGAGLEDRVSAEELPSGTWLILGFRE